MSRDAVGVLTRLAASAVGASVGGPFGTWCCGVAGQFLTKEAATHLSGLITGGTNTFQSVASNYCYDKLKDLLIVPSPAPLQGAVETALARALAKADPDGHPDWLSNWQRRLRHGPFLFSDCRAVYREFLGHAAESGADSHDAALQQLHIQIMERLDFEARAMDGGVPEERPMPETLRAFVRNDLPVLMDAELTLVFAEEGHKAAWVATERSFQAHVTSELAQMRAMLAQVLANQAAPPAVLERLERELAGTKLELDQVRKKAEEYLKQYADLVESLRRHPGDPSSAEARALIERGQFERAGELLDGIIADEAGELKRLARRRYERGKLHELQFQPVPALEQYRHAHNLAPDDREIAFACALLLQKQLRFGEAIALYLSILAADRSLALANPDAFRPDVAMTLNNLAVLYSDTQRMREAEQAFSEALQIRRALAEVNPDAYRPSVATTLNNLALLYSDTQRMREA
ncbi:MAG: tetratricopeptide repeat protein, partial [Acidobacteriota bacterium]